MKVNVSGTIAKDRRPDCGLDDIGEKMHANRLTRVAVVGIIEYHAYHDVAGKGETLAIRFAAIEPLEGKDDLTARTLLDKARKARGLGATELTLFDTVDDDRDGDAKGPWPGDPDYIARDRSDLAGTAPAANPAEVPAPKKARANKRNALAAVPAE